TWGHPATAADKQAATSLLSELMRAQGIDPSLIPRMGELIQNPESLSQDEFATCGLHSVVYSLLKSDLAGFSRVASAVFTGVLKDAEGNTTGRFQNKDAQSDLANPVAAVLSGKVEPKAIPSKLLSNALKKITNRYGTE